jgi:hypothetical protein
VIVLETSASALIGGALKFLLAHCVCQFIMLQPCGSERSAESCADRKGMGDIRGTSCPKLVPRKWFAENQLLWWAPILLLLLNHHHLLIVLQYFSYLNLGL